MKNKKNGSGVLYYKSGASYNGEWVDDKACNHGIITYVNKDVYEGIIFFIKGNFLNGKKHGNGVYHYKTGGKYKGEWIEDRKQGYGIMDYANKDKYEGYWLRGERSGEGTYEYSNGDTYTGEWKCDSKNGHGVL